MVLTAWTVAGLPVTWWMLTTVVAMCLACLALGWSQWSRRPAAAPATGATGVRRGDRVAGTLLALTLLSALPTLVGVTRVRRWTAATNSMALIAQRVAFAWYTTDDAWRAVIPPEQTGVLQLVRFAAHPTGYSLVYAAIADPSLQCEMRVPQSTVRCFAPWYDDDDESPLPARRPDAPPSSVPIVPNAPMQQLRIAGGGVAGEES